MRASPVSATAILLLLACFVLFLTQVLPRPGDADPLSPQGPWFRPNPNAYCPHSRPPPGTAYGDGRGSFGQDGLPKQAPGPAADWEFDYRRDGKNYGLSEDQCLSAFPRLFKEIDRAVAHRRKVGNITLDEVDPGWRGDGIVRVLIRDNELYIVNANAVTDANHRPRSLATLHSIHRALVAHPAPLPTVEFTITDHDSALFGEHDHHTTLAYSRLAAQESLWLMPDFGLWGWPNVGLRSFSELQTNLDFTEDDFLDKIPQLVWRGSLATAGGDLRRALVEASAGRSWSDVRTLDWKNASNIQANLLGMEQHCEYMFLAQTEGNTYSGRLKYLLNCHSIVLSHPLRWIEHYHHLLSSSGPDQNYIQLDRSWTKLPHVMDMFTSSPRQLQAAAAIADNARAIFRERYLTPAAEACYWRALMRGWASVQGFEPEVWIRKDVEGRKRPRGTPFEAYAIMEQTEWEIPAKPRTVCTAE